MPPMEWIWLAALVIFAILEAATSTLVSLWFIGGSLTAMIAALCGAEGPLLRKLYEAVTTDAALELLQQAAVLSEQRKVAAVAFAQQLVQMVAPLGMPHTRFQVEVVPRKEPESDGMHEIRFLFSANKSMALQPVAQTASGGEISRLMLCIKAMIAGFTALPTIMQGVSGIIQF